MRFKIEGVNAETGKKVSPQEIEAADQREAATQAKLLNVLPTRITPITELLNVDIRDPNSDEPTKTRRTTLISIDGHPKWFVATLILGLLIVSMLIFGRIQKTDSQTTMPASVVAGLGWSLKDVEDKWSSKNGWYWEDKGRPRIGVGIKYTASNVEIPWLALQVLGQPGDLHTFRIAAVVGIDEFLTSSEQIERFGIACLMIDQIIDYNSNLLIAWEAESIGSWAQNPEMPFQASRIWNERLVDLSIDSNDEGYSLILTVTVSE